MSIQVDELLLNLVHEISSIRAGKTFTPTHYTDPVAKQIEALIQQKQLEARLDELKRLRDMPDSELESYGNEIEDRITQLSTPPKKEETDK